MKYARLLSGALIDISPITCTTANLSDVAHALHTFLQLPAHHSIVMNLDNTNIVNVMVNIHIPTNLVLFVKYGMNLLSAKKFIDRISEQEAYMRTVLSLRNEMEEDEEDENEESEEEDDDENEEDDEEDENEESEEDLGMEDFLDMYLSSPTRYPYWVEAAQDKATILQLIHHEWVGLRDAHDVRDYISRNLPSDAIFPDLAKWAVVAELSTVIRETGEWTPLFDVLKIRMKWSEGEKDKLGTELAETMNGWLTTFADTPQRIPADIYKNVKAFQKLMNWCTDLLGDTHFRSKLIALMSSSSSSPLGPLAEEEGEIPWSDLIMEERVSLFRNGEKVIHAKVVSALLTREF